MTKDSIVKIKLKFSKNAKIAAVAVTILVLAVAAYYAAPVLYNVYWPKPITSWNYHGMIVNFRADLRESAKVPVYPGEDYVYLDLVHALADNVTFAYMYVNGTLENGVNPNSYYILEIVQIVQNIIPAYEYAWKFTPSFDSMNVTSYENLPGKIQNPIIAIVPPAYSNETAIRNEGHVTFLKAKTYEDLDLVVTKLLMIALHIDLDSPSC
jgi:hypothetical protein